MSQDLGVGGTAGSEVGVKSREGEGNFVLGSVVLFML
jgi:hypothetical protein